MNENSEKSPKPYSFRFAYDSLPKMKQAEVREKLRKVLGVKGNVSVYLRISGEIEPKASEAKAIEQLFKSYGIKITWGR
jgi:hypothetical protein